MPLDTNFYLFLFKLLTVFGVLVGVGAGVAVQQGKVPGKVTG